MDKMPHGPWRTADAAPYDDSPRITHCDSPPSSTPPTPPAASRATACARTRAGRARWRMLHPARIERGSPALLVVPRELEIVALASHADRDPADAGPAVEPGTQGLSARSYEGRGSLAKPSAAMRSRPRWSSTQRSYPGGGATSTSPLVDTARASSRSRVVFT